MLYKFGVGYMKQFTHRSVPVAIRSTDSTLVQTVSLQVVLYELKATNGRYIEYKILLSKYSIISEIFILNNNVLGAI